MPPPSPVRAQTLVASPMGKHIFFRLLFTMLISMVLGGCTVMQAAKARLEPRDQFLSSSVHPQLRFRPGSEDMARRMAVALDASIAVVEKQHGRPFLEPPTVYVCDADCFVRFSTFRPSVPAGQFMDSVFMNDPDLRSKERQFGMAPENFLVHELTHLMFYQYAGAAAYMSTPAWFREGWAVVVSDGAGAQACTPEEAARLLLAGSSFDPEEKGSVFRNRTASSYGLRYPVFYRQAAMFVNYLRDIDSAAFQVALHGVLDGERFQAAFERAYGNTIASHWDGFRESLRKPAGHMPLQIQRPE
ncbi:MAG: hypothetical protein ACO1NO_01320 [Burkholderiaceae bacterium]